MGGCSLRFPQFFQTESLGLIYFSPHLGLNHQVAAAPEPWESAWSGLGVEFNFILGNHLENLGNYHFFEVAGFTYLGGGFIFFWNIFTPKLGKIMIQFWLMIFFHMGWFNPPRRKFGSSPLLGKRSPLWLQQFTEKNVKFFFWWGWAAGTS